MHALLQRSELEQAGGRPYGTLNATIIRSVRKQFGQPFKRLFVQAFTLRAYPALQSSAAALENGRSDRAEFIR